MPQHEASLITTSHVKGPGCSLHCLFSRKGALTSTHQNKQKIYNQSSIPCHVPSTDINQDLSSQLQEALPNLLPAAIITLMKNWEHPMEFLIELTEELTGGSFQPHTPVELHQFNTSKDD